MKKKDIVETLRVAVTAGRVFYSAFRVEIVETCYGCCIVLAEPNGKDVFTCEKIEVDLDRSIATFNGQYTIDFGRDDRRRDFLKSRFEIMFSELLVAAFNEIRRRDIEDHYVPLRQPMGRINRALVPVSPMSVRDRYYGFAEN